MKNLILFLSLILLLICPAIGQVETGAVWEGAFDFKALVGIGPLKKYEGLNCKAFRISRSSLSEYYNRNVKFDSNEWHGIQTPEGRNRDHVKGIPFNPSRKRPVAIKGYIKGLKYKNGKILSVDLFGDMMSDSLSGLSVNLTEKEIEEAAKDKPRHWSFKNTTRKQMIEAFRFNNPSKAIMVTYFLIRLAEGDPTDFLKTWRDEVVGTPVGLNGKRAKIIGRVARIKLSTEGKKERGFIKELTMYGKTEGQKMGKPKFWRFLGSKNIKKISIFDRLALIEVCDKLLKSEKGENNVYFYPAKGGEALLCINDKEGKKIREVKSMWGPNGEEVKKEEKEAKKTK